MAPPAPDPRASATATATRLAVVGTAGHIDHGKTALVHRLTGVDTDRLPEEKKRGISIDLGFAPLVTPAGVHVGIVDVPGHERFVKNMLAGVGGIDCAMLVVAADEGVMPQTREHLAIVRLLGIPRGIVVLTKCDLAEREWIELVKKDVRALLAGTVLAEAPMVEFSAVTGAGQADVLAALDQQLAALPNRSTDDPARLPVDRVFTIEGFGTVVTGTLWRGRVRTGDALEVLPIGRTVRVRRVQVHGATVEEARAGQRTALALHGVEKEEIERGDWVVAPGSLRAAPILDVRFELLPDYPKAWGANTRVRFHLGASEIIGRLVLLEGEALKPGASALAQVRLEKRAVAARGDRFVVRAYSPARTIGGGTVIEPVAGKRRRAAAGLESLAVHESGSLEARLIERLGAETKPVTTAVIAKAVGESEARVAEALAGFGEHGGVVALPGGNWVAIAVWQEALETILREVGEYTVKYPARFGVPKGELKSALKSVIESTLFDAAFGSLAARAVLVMRGDRVRPAAQPWSPPPAMMVALAHLEEDLEKAGFSVPETPAWQAKLGPNGAEVLALGYFLGRLVRVSQEFTYTANQMQSLRDRLGAHFAKKPTMSVAEFKELTVASRKYAVPLLEHCDRMGWTVRVGDERKAGGKTN